MNNQGTAPVGRFNLANLLILLLMLLALSACGGGDDDPVPSVSVDSPVVTEGDTGTVPMTFTLTLSEAQDAAFSVNVATADGTAEAVSDYTARSGEIVTFLAGSTSATFTVDIAGDDDFEVDETLSLVISNAQGVNATGTGTITNDDDADPAGYYSGSATVNGANYSDLTGMVYANRLLMFSPSANLLYDISLDTVTLTDYSGTAQVYINGDITDTDSRQDVALSGSTDEATISGSFSGSTGFGDGSFTLTYDENNNIGATIDRIVVTGTVLKRWIGDIYGVEVSQDVGQFIPSSDGSYVAGDQGAPSCLYTGNLGIPPSAVNIYQLAHDVEDVNSCQYISTNHTGFASVISINGVDTLVYAFASASGGYSLFYIGEKA